MRTEPTRSSDMLSITTLRNPKEIVLVLICIIQNTTYHISEQLLLVIQQSQGESVSYPP